MKANTAVIVSALYSADHNKTRSALTGVGEHQVNVCLESTVLLTLRVFDGEE